MVSDVSSQAVVVCSSLSSIFGSSLSSISGLQGIPAMPRQCFAGSRRLHLQQRFVKRRRRRSDLSDSDSAVTRLASSGCKTSQHCIASASRVVVGSICSHASAGVGVFAQVPSASAATCLASSGCKASQQCAGSSRQSSTPLVAPFRQASASTRRSHLRQPVLVHHPRVARHSRNAPPVIRAPHVLQPSLHPAVSARRCWERRAL